MGLSCMVFFIEVKRIVSRSEEHTSELLSPCNLVCRLLLEKKKIRWRGLGGTRSQDQESWIRLHGSVVRYQESVTGNQESIRRPDVFPMPESLLITTNS